MRLTRAAVCAVVSLTGLALAVSPARTLASPSSTPTLVLGVLGLLVAAVLVAAGGYLFKSDVETTHARRIAGWNLLGVVVLGSVLVLSDAAVGGTIPTLVTSDVLAVSAFAHVLIGVNDVRRIRAEEVADAGRKLAVLHRVLRHNLRTEAQALAGYADLIADGVDDGDVMEYAETIQTRAGRLVSMNEDVEYLLWGVRDGAVSTEPVALSDLLAAVAADVRTAYPDAAVEVACADDLSVSAGDALEVALEHLLTNAVAHNDANAPHVRVAVTADDRWTDVRIEDDGPGIPDVERDVVAGDVEITQLTHGSGLGLWVVQSIADAYGGEFRVDSLGADGDSRGTRATLRLPTA